MKATILLAIVCIATVMARQPNSYEWEQYKRQHGKVYEAPEEDARRFSLFLASRELIREHNSNERASYKLGLNHMADWSHEERVLLKGLGHDRIRSQKKHAEPSTDHQFLQGLLASPHPPPAEFDWRKVPNRVGPVRDQGRCAGASFAFATTGVLEGQQVVRNFTNELVTLSEQDLLECSVSNEQSCDEGGLMSDALGDIAKMGGIESAKDYPYTGLDDTKCEFNKSKVVMTVSGSMDFPNWWRVDDVLKGSVSSFGPIAIGLDACPGFIHYKSGIFNDPSCVHHLNYGALVVGYGQDPVEGLYWIVKTSWSEKWGEKGYAKVKHGVCQIGALSTIPTFDQ
uniref:Cathepsin L n=1 Tax=Aceria tosichella TaxID=561515 RepID=A0A6G1SL30_9ACAR